MPDTDWRAGDVVRLCGGTIVVCGPNDVTNRWINVSEVDIDGESLEFLEDYQVEESGPVLLLRDGVPVLSTLQQAVRRDPGRRLNGVVNTIANAIRSVGIYHADTTSDIELDLVAGTIANQLEGIIPEEYYDDGRG